MSFRHATADDVDFFWRWREHAEAQPWYAGPRTTRKQHDIWFSERLFSRVTMLVWERMDHSGPSGCVRIDSNGEVALNARPDLLLGMLRELLPYAEEQWGHRLKVTLDHGDRKTAKALKQAGFREYPVKFFCYRP